MLQNLIQRKHIRVPLTITRMKTAKHRKRIKGCLLMNVSVLASVHFVWCKAICSVL